MIESMKFWIDPTDVDGYRFDVAWNVTRGFWREVRAAPDRIKPVFLIPATP
jgi:glycosidase